MRSKYLYNYGQTTGTYCIIVLHCSIILYRLQVNEIINGIVLYSGLAIVMNFRTYNAIGQ